MIAVTQLRNPGTEGRVYFDRKVADGNGRLVGQVTPEPDNQLKPVDGCDLHQCGNLLGT